MNAFTVFF